LSNTQASAPSSMRCSPCYVGGSRMVRRAGAPASTTLAKLYRPMALVLRARVVTGPLRRVRPASLRLRATFSAVPMSGGLESAEPPRRGPRALPRGRGRAHGGGRHGGGLHRGATRYVHARGDGSAVGGVCGDAGASRVSLSVTPHHSRRSCCFALTFASVRSLPPSRSWRSWLRSVSRAVVARAHALGLRHVPTRPFQTERDMAATNEMPSRYVQPITNLRPYRVGRARSTTGKS